VCVRYTEKETHRQNGNGELLFHLILPGSALDDNSTAHNSAGFDQDKLPLGDAWH
jgi:hypothetical protein